MEIWQELEILANRLHGRDRQLVMRAAVKLMDPSDAVIRYAGKACVPEFAAIDLDMRTSEVGRVLAEAGYTRARITMDGQAYTLWHKRCDFPKAELFKIIRERPL